MDDAPRQQLVNAGASTPAVTSSSGPAAADIEDIAGEGSAAGTTKLGPRPRVTKRLLASTPLKENVDIRFPEEVRNLSVLVFDICTPAC